MRISDWSADVCYSDLFFPSNALTGPEIQVTVRKPQALLLSLAVALALSACTGDKADNAAAADATADSANEAPALTLEGSKLPPVNRFQHADLDSSKNACGALQACANGKWLAANEVPGDTTPEIGNAPSREKV